MIGLTIAAISIALPTLIQAAPADQHARESASIPTELQGEPWHQIIGQIEADRHEIRHQNRDWHAHTPGQKYSTLFGPDGPTLNVRDGESEHQVEFAFAAAEVDGQPLNTDSPERRAAGNRLEYQRGPLTEWYVNRPEGLEQGFTIKRAPAGRLLRIEMTVHSALTASESNNELILSEKARQVFRYAGLKAWDANGEALTASMDLLGTRLALVVDVADARFPVTVDPVMFNETAKLTPNLPPDAFGGPGDWAGRALSLDGDRALVGARGSDDDGFFENGEAYIFQRDPGTGNWQFAARLAPGDPRSNQRFGFSVSLSGDRALIGANGDDDNGSASGSAYVFDFDGNDWTETDKLTPADGAAGDQFGNSVSLSGDRVLVGAFADADNGSASGSAYVFDFDGTDWIETDKLTPADGAAADQFGVSVSLSGDRALIGANGDDDNGNASGSAYVFDFDGTNWTETNKLTPTDGAAVDQFGFSVSLSGDRALIGAYFDDDNGGDSGSAYVFDFDGTNWTETDKLTPADGAAADQFGVSVSLSGNRALIGAYLDDDNGSNSGSAYVFDFDGTDWTEADKLTPADGAAGDQLGFSVSLSGDRVLIGAFADDDNGSASGSAYVFDFNGTGWTETDKLIPADGTTGDQFGFSVSLSGDRALIGAYLDDDNGSDSGSAYVFDFNGTEWTETDKLTPADGTVGDSFGFSVSLFGDRALIGAFLDDDNGGNSGSAYVFDFDGTDWTETDKLTPADGTAGDSFGLSVSLSGDRALIGAYLDDDNGSDSGSAYVFDFDGTDWTETDKLTPADGAISDFFGFSVSLSGDRALIGAYLDDDNGSDSGSAYVFDFDGTDWTEADKLTPADGAAGDQLGLSVSLSGDRALVSAFADDDNGSDSGSAYVFDFDGTNWTETDKLTPADGAADDWFGRSVSLSGDRVLIGAFLDDDNGSASGSAYVFDFDGTDWTETDKLTPADGAAVDQFGRSVSLSGDRALIGAIGDDDNGTNSGSAFVFSVILSDFIFSDRFEEPANK